MPVEGGGEFADEVGVAVCLAGERISEVIFRKGLGWLEWEIGKGGWWWK